MKAHGFPLRWMIVHQAEKRRGAAKLCIQIAEMTAPPVADGRWLLTAGWEDPEKRYGETLGYELLGSHESIAAAQKAADVYVTQWCERFSE